jgi:DNA-directed RNA polymerase subunit RPC12/RpoP
MASSDTAAKAKSRPIKPAAVPPPADGIWQSRAVSRLIEAGSVAECPHCGERVKFRARHRDRQVICNVYEDGVWQRVEQYHEACYTEAGEPYGEAVMA